MTNSRTVLVLLLAGAVGLGVLFYVLPRQSSTDLEKVSEASSFELTDVDRAAEKVANGSNPMEGVKELLAMVEKDSTNVEAQLYLARFAVQSGQYDKALARYQTITRVAPESIDGWWELASLYFETGKSAEAEPLFGKVLELDPESTNALFFQGKCVELNGDTARALELYEAFLPYAPDSAVQIGVERIINELKTK
ncbi:MAG: cytochrome c-type biogenesis protein CcmH/NrfG [Litorivivens sp.]|jgi:cytochrome c-type biogenesis protein CcmH/NrfG